MTPDNPLGMWGRSSGYYRPPSKPKPAKLTPRQAEALAWLDTVGKATPKTLKRHGFQDRTLNALCERGLIDRELHPTPQGGFAVYRPKDKS